MALSGLDRHDEALEAFDRALEGAPDEPALHNNRGEALSKLTRFADAVDAFDRGLALDEDYAPLYFGRARR